MGSQRLIVILNEGILLRGEGGAENNRQERVTTPGSQEVNCMAGHLTAHWWKFEPMIFEPALPRFFRTTPGVSHLL